MSVIDLGAIVAMLLLPSCVLVMVCDHALLHSLSALTSFVGVGVTIGCHVVLGASYVDGDIGVGGMNTCTGAT